MPAYPVMVVPLMVVTVGVVPVSVSAVIVCHAQPWDGHWPTSSSTKNVSL